MRLHPERGRRFANAMSAYAEKIPLEPLIEGYDWGSLCDVRIADGEEIMIFFLGFLAFES